MIEQHFKIYVYGVAFGIVSDHKALQSVRRSNRGNKTFPNRLTGWMNRLPPFESLLYILSGELWEWQNICLDILQFKKGR